MTKRITLTLSILAVSLTLAAQQPVNIVNNVLARLKASPCSATFDLKQRQARGMQDVNLGGTIVMQDQQFFVDTRDMKAWYDGKTQWVYMADQNEVSITEPTAEEAADMNPMLLVKAYTDNCHLMFSATDKSTTHYVIEFYPKDKMSELLCLTLRVRKSDNMPTSIHITTSKGGETRLTLSNIKSGVTATTATFRYDGRFKKAYINDLR